jgi:hypothetical protein
VAITVTVDTRPPFRLLGELERQIPFAASLGMNNALKDAQLAVTRHVLSTFVVRRTKYIKQSIKISKFSTKTDLTAVLEIDPTRDVLAKFEPGGVKTSTRPDGSIVVPVEARRSVQGVIPKAERPRAFQFQYHGRGAKAVIFRGRDRTFLVRKPGKRGAIFQRVGPPVRRGKGVTPHQRAQSKLRLLYVLTPGARIPATLHFKETAIREFQDRWPRAYRAALHRALRTAR